MSLGQNNNVGTPESLKVQTSLLEERSKLVQTIRGFFQNKGYLEVETPLLCSHSVTDPFITSFCLPTHHSLLTTHGKNQRFLQTSPEYCMKRLLTEGSGPIFQICKAFRVDEPSNKHNPEFTMLEWYQPGFDHHDLMNEVDQLLQTVLGCNAAEKISYANLFLQHLNVNPQLASAEQLAQVATQHQIQINNTENFSKVTWLEILFTHVIEPKLGFDQPAFIYDFPVEMAALAKIRNAQPPVAKRFEVYVKGTELANGFHELTDAKLQRQRFEADNQKRQALGLEPMPIDEFFLGALEKGLPDCAGVALGIDRLVMLALKQQNITEVISFNWQQC